MSEVMDITNYLKQGGVLSSPDNVPARYRGELMRLMSSFVDSQLAASAGYATAINFAPNIDARLAACQITLEKVKHARAILNIMENFGTDVKRYEEKHDWTYRVARDTEASANRLGSDMRLSVFYYPLINWLDSIVMSVVQGVAAIVQLEELSNASYAPVAEIFRTILPTEKLHLEVGLRGLKAILANKDNEKAVIESFKYWHERAALGFGKAESERYEKLKNMGLRHESNTALQKLWQERLDQSMKAFSLTF